MHVLALVEIVCFSSLALTLYKHGVTTFIVSFLILPFHMFHTFILNVILSYRKSSFSYVSSLRGQGVVQFADERNHSAQDKIVNKLKHKCLFKCGIS